MDTALEWLERAIDARQLIILMPFHIDFDVMRTDPRYEQVLERRGIPLQPESTARMAGRRHTDR